MSKKTKIITIIIVLLLLLLSITFYIKKKQLDAQKDGSYLSGYILDKGVAPNMTQEEIEALLQKQVDASKIAFRINSEPIFKGKRGNIVFANPRYSAHNISLEVKLDDKTIMRTDKISPDHYIKEIELIGGSLKKGLHIANGMITAYDQETDEVIGQVAVELKITSK